MRIAIIGSGISGLTAAYLLHRHHEITIYEKAARCGGHTATVDITLEGKSYAIDTGFIVYNDWTYPNFIRLMDRLGVSSKPTEMGFSVTTRHASSDPAGSDFEYCGSTLTSLFADRRQLANPQFLGMLKDIVLFNRRAKQDLAHDRITAGHSLDTYLQPRRYGRYFLDYYLRPMAAAIWSAPTARVGDFNALFFLRFFQNHGLLNINHRPQWRVIEGGSRRYLEPLTAGFSDRFRLGSDLRAVRRVGDTITLSSPDGDEIYDQVIFACHSDQALALLEDPADEEREMLGAIPWRNNSVVLHTDPALLPRRQNAWTSWNYLLDGGESRRPVLTYNMNILQGIRSSRPLCVSVNGDAYIDQSRVLAKFSYAHPQFGRHSVAAQRARTRINGSRRTWFCGAYWGNGFHEDGVVSALPIAEALGGDRLR